MGCEVFKQEEIRKILCVWGLTSPIGWGRLSSMQDTEEAVLINRAFDLVDELNAIQSRLHKTHTLKIESLNVATHLQAHEVYSYRLQVSREVQRDRDK